MQTLAPRFEERDRGRAPSSHSSPPAHLSPNITYRQKGYTSLQRNYGPEDPPLNHNQVHIVANGNTAERTGSLPEKNRPSNKQTSQLNANSRLSNSQHSKLPQNGYITRTSSPMIQSREHSKALSGNGVTRATPSSQSNALAHPVHTRSSSHDAHSNRLSNGPVADSTTNPPPIVPRRQKKHPDRRKAPHKNQKNQHVNNPHDTSHLDRNLANHLLVKDSHVIGNQGVLYTVASTPL